MLVKKGIKANSQDGDGHPNGDTCIIFGGFLSPDELKHKAKGMYLVLFSNDALPVMTIMEKIEITDETLSSFTPESVTQLYLASILETLKAMNFKLYDN